MGDKMKNLKTSLFEDDKKTNSLSVKMKDFSHARNDEPLGFTEESGGGFQTWMK